jgi:type IV secretory pathway TraG/TraD family ATPase VirD4
MILLLVSMPSEWKLSHSKTRHDGRETSEGEQEHAIPLLSKQDILMMPDEKVIGFCRNYRPFQANRVNWLSSPILKARQQIASPPLPVLPKLEETQFDSVRSEPQPAPFSYVSPNRV